VGLYYDTHAGSHGFLRNTDGSFIAFDPPGSNSTLPYAITTSGQIVGFYEDAVGTHGFLRMTNGTFSTLDVPGSLRTLPRSANSRGQITGQYDDSNFAEHAFMRNTDGTYTSFDACAETFPNAINFVGQITGDCLDWKGTHAFLSSPRKPRAH
jgi:hypothetical protein